MISITSEAAQQIRESAKQGQMEGLPLRLAAMRNEDGSLHYAMGFADEEFDNDLQITSEGITIVIAPTSVDLLRDTVLDYVTLENGETNFIFKNPNDPNYQPTE